MKKISVCMILIIFAAFSLGADESDVILQAQTDATEDGQNCHAFLWGVGGVAVTALPVVLVAFFGDAISVEARRTIALTAPVAGGTSLALLGFFPEKPKRRLHESLKSKTNTLIQVSYRFMNRSMRRL